MLGLLFAICCLTVLGIAGFIWISTGRICSLYTARNFLDEVRKVPSDTFLILVKASGYMLLLGVSYLIRNNVRSERYPLAAITLLLDFLISIRIIWLLDFNYNGVLLWCFANFLIHAGKNRLWPVVITVGIFGYAFTSFDLMSIRKALFDVQDYISLYTSGVQPYLLGVYNLMTVLTIVCFIGCCLLIIIGKEEKIEEINELYAKLSLANANLKQANEELSDIMEENAKMAEIRERNRIAREIHDTMGHTLTGIAAGIDACIALSDSSPELVKAQLKVLSDVSRQGISDVRHSVNELRPDALERLNLEAAIRELLESTVKTTGTQVEFICDVPVLKFDEDEENAIYRVIQESITNAIRHGHATKIQVSMKKEEGEIHLHISDNGHGCESLKEGFGTRHIRERIEMLHGRVNFKNENGFHVEAVVPIRWGEEYD